MMLSGAICASAQTSEDEPKAPLRKVAKVVNYKMKPISGIVIDAATKEPIEYIDMRNPNNIFVKVKTTKIRLGKIDGSIYDRIERIPSILPQIKIVKSNVDYLDVSWEKVNYLKLK
jgi:hypothetical protein